MLSRTYRCQATASTPDDGRTFPLGTHAAGSPRLALRWLRQRARHISDQLDPPAARPVLAWLHDDQAHEHALEAVVFPRVMGAFPLVRYRWGV
ncbi:hypothetical protein SAMN05192584_10541 [Streptomyces pini]|uniref:Uncharacterized protein n=1 Tax=Streptomyces pini TaxID=1520580 RepID=A0A1I3YFJ4_9ACTN|nr:hypothetical protein SAMN05192584_10541 [Streptomyces pini]